MAKRPIPDPNFQVPVHQPTRKQRDVDQRCETCGATGRVNGALCATCGGCGYMVDVITERDGVQLGWLCGECEKAGRARSFMVFQDITYHWVTATYERYDQDGDPVLEDRRVQAPYATYRCAWGHEFTDGY